MAGREADGGTLGGGGDTGASVAGGALAGGWVAGDGLAGGWVAGDWVAGGSLVDGWLDDDAVAGLLLAGTWVAGGSLAGVALATLGVGLDVTWTDGDGTVLEVAVGAAVAAALGLDVGTVVRLAPGVALARRRVRRRQSDDGHGIAAGRIRTDDDRLVPLGRLDDRPWPGRDRHGLRVLVTDRRAVRFLIVGADLGNGGDVVGVGAVVGRSDPPHVSRTDDHRRRSSDRLCRFGDR